MPSIRIFTQPFALLTPIDILMDILLILVIAIIVILGLRKLLAREKNEEFRKIKTYFLMFKEGFYIVRKHIWIFLVPLFITLLNFLYGALIRVSWYHKHAEKIAKSVEEAAEGKTKIIPLIWGFKSWRQILLHGLEYFRLGTRNYQIEAIIFFLIVLFGISLIKKYLNRFKETDLKESVVFVDKLLLPSLVFSVLFFAGMFLFCRGKFRELAAWPVALVLPGLWFGAGFISLLEGGILSIIDRAIKGEKLMRSGIMSYALRYFKPLFLFHIILAVILLIPELPFLLSVSLGKTYWRPSGSFLQIYQFYHTFIPHIINLFIIFIPCIIVKEGLGFSSALKSNFILWKRNFVKCSFFIICGAIILFIPLKIDNILRCLLAWRPWMNLSIRPFTTALVVLFNLVVIAATMIFYSSVSSGKVISVKTAEFQN